MGTQKRGVSNVDLGDYTYLYTLTHAHGNACANPVGIMRSGLGHNFQPFGRYYVPSDLRSSVTEWATAVRPMVCFSWGTIPNPHYPTELVDSPFGATCTRIHEASPCGCSRLRTYIRTRADGLSTPLRGVLFYQKKNLPSDLELSNPSP